MKKIAVVLMNLGGPSDQKSVRPFLFNLFSDPAIIPRSPPLRYFLALLISTLRAKKARKIYQQLGGGSPLLENTQKQQQALSEQLNENAPPSVQYKVFIAMRYWHPLTPQTAVKVQKYQPDEIVLLPLYPQFSTATSASSLNAWYQEAEKIGLCVPTTQTCCYPTSSGFIAANRSFILYELGAVAQQGPVRLLFSAHGLPQQFIDHGDSYEWQITQTVEAVMACIQADYRICYQSKVGPTKWLGPSIDDEIKQAARDGVGVIVVPISFVSEHSETLVELDIDYLQKAQEYGVPFYRRVPTVGASPLFIADLAKMVTAARSSLVPICPDHFTKCWCRSHA